MFLHVHHQTHLCITNCISYSALAHVQGHMHRSHAISETGKACGR